MRMIVITMHVINVILYIVSITLSISGVLEFRTSPDPKKVNEGIYEKHTIPYLQATMAIRLIAFMLHFILSHKLNKLPVLFEMLQNSKDGKIIFGDTVTSNLQNKEKFVSKCVFLMLTFVLLISPITFAYNRWNNGFIELDMIIFTTFADMAKMNHLLMFHQFALLNYMLCNRFALLNEKMQQLVSIIDDVNENTNVEESTWQNVTYPGWKNYKVEFRTPSIQRIHFPDFISTMRSIGRIYTILCNAIDIICNGFKLQILFSLFHLFLYMVLFGYTSVEHNTSLFNFILNEGTIRVWRNLGFCLFLVMEICLSGEMSTSEASRCSTLASQIDSSLLHSSVRQEALSLVNRMSYRKPVYNLCGVFHINATFFASAIAGMITCITLLVQLM